MPNCPKRFTTYRFAVQDSLARVSLRTDGFYFSPEKHDAFLFESDGLVRELPFRIPLSKSGVDSTRVIEDMQAFYKVTPRDYWGAYRIFGDSLQLQWFNYHQTEVCKRSVFDYRGVVLNDTTFVITSRIAYWFADTATTGRFVYRFYRTDFKPDDSKTWFEKKRWYLRGRDPSRER